MIPQNNFLIVRLSEAEQVSAGGILLATERTEGARRAEVAFIGANAARELSRSPMVGAQLLIRPHGGYQVQHEGEKLLAIHYEDVIAIQSAPSSQPGGDVIHMQV